ncbi:MAG: hypothetical protein ACPH4H_04330, partial [Candidatus Poseidoniaceae archaeon]
IDQNQLDIDPIFQSLEDIRFSGDLKGHRCPIVNLHMSQSLQKADKSASRSSNRGGKSAKCSKE